MEDNFIMTISDLRKALRGLSGSADFRVKIPHKSGGFIVTSPIRVKYDANWKSYMMILPDQI